MPESLQFISQQQRLQLLNFFFRIVCFFFHSLWPLLGIDYVWSITQTASRGCIEFVALTFNGRSKFNSRSAYFNQFPATLGLNAVAQLSAIHFTARSVISNRWKAEPNQNTEWSGKKINLVSHFTKKFRIFVLLKSLIVANEELEWKRSRLMSSDCIPMMSKGDLSKWYFYKLITTQNSPRNFHWTKSYAEQLEQRGLFLFSV